MKIIKITVDGVDYTVSRDLTERAGLCRPETCDSPETLTSALAVVAWIVLSAALVILGLIWGCL